MVVLLVENLVGQVAAVALLHVRLARRRHVAQVADLVGDELVEERRARSGRRRHWRSFTTTLVHGGGGGGGGGAVLHLVRLDARLLLMHRAAATTASGSGRKRLGGRTTTRRPAHEYVAGLDVQVHEVERVHVGEAFGHLHQQRLQIVLVHDELLLTVVIVTKRLVGGVAGAERVDELGQGAAVAVLALYEHAVALGPRRVVLHDVAVLDEDGVGAHLLPGGYLERGAVGNGALGALDGVGETVQAVDALEDVAELAAAQLAHLVELLVVARHRALAQRQALVAHARRVRRRRRRGSEIVERSTAGGTCVVVVSCLSLRCWFALGGEQDGCGRRSGRVLTLLDNGGRVAGARLLGRVERVGGRERVDVGVVAAAAAAAAETLLLLQLAEDRLWKTTLRLRVLSMLSGSEVGRRSVVARDVVEDGDALERAAHARHTAAAHRAEERRLDRCRRRWRVCSSCSCCCYRHLLVAIVEHGHGGGRCRLAAAVLQRRASADVVALLLIVNNVVVFVIIVEAKRFVGACSGGGSHVHPANAERRVVVVVVVRLVPLHRVVVVVGGCETLLMMMLVLVSSGRERQRWRGVGVERES